MAKDRVISTVDPEARHGHKSKNRHFDGYKAHLSIDPDSELIDEVVATPANTRCPRPWPTCSPATPTTGTSRGPRRLCLAAAARADLEAQGFPVTAKAAPVRNSTGGFTKEHFAIDLEAGTVTCPAGHNVLVRFGRGGEGKASFKGHCRHCPLKSQCTPSHRGRTISVHPQEALLRRAAPSRKAPSGKPVTNRHGQLSSARSPISPGGRGAGARPG